MFGIESFVSHHSGFSGVIKYDFMDFVVNEIDMHGSVVRVDETYKNCAPGIDDEGRARTLDEYIAVEEERHVTLDGKNEGKIFHKCCLQEDVRDVNTDHHSADFKKTKTTLQQPLSNSTHHAEERPEQSDNVQSKFDEKIMTRNSRMCKSAYLERLQDIFGDETIEKLCAFAETEFDFNLPSSKKTVNVEQFFKTHKRATFSVGVVFSKETRTEIHNAIRSVFPHLCTDTKKPSGGGDGLEILIETNTTYWKLRRFIAADDIDDFLCFVDEKDRSKTFNLTCPDDKEARTQIHRLISKYYGSFLETKTKNVLSDGSDQDKSRKIVVRFREDSREKARRGHKRKATGGKIIFSGFVLKKENMEMLDVINKLAVILQVHPPDFSYAGMKDKKAITTQLMCVKGVTTQRFKSLTAKTDVAGIQVGNIHPLHGPIQRGQLKGNQFDIIVRDVKLRMSDDGELDETLTAARVEEEIKTAIDNVKTHMFVNYFGQQRFGSISDVQGNAANIGLEVLKGNHVQAVKYLLSPVEGKDDPVNKAKKFFQETQDTKTTLSMMPNYKSRECMLLKALHRHGLDHDGCTKALLNIPHSMRQLYVHSYCSLVWNRMATQRIQLYGVKLVEGDFVIPAGVDKAFTRDQVHVVTKEDISSEFFTIKDLVLPLLGNAIQYPTNKLGHLYQQYLEQDGLSQNSFRLNSLKINIPGDYRKLFACPTDVTYNIYPETCSSSDKTAQSEVSRITPVATTSDGICKGTGSEGNYTHQEQINLRLSFKLPASSYATMCVREMMKQ